MECLDTELNSNNGTNNISWVIIVGDFNKDLEPLSKM